MRLRFFLPLACGILTACSAGGGSSKPVGPGSGGSAGAEDASVMPEGSVIDTGMTTDTAAETTIVEGGYDASKPDAVSQCSDAPPPAAQIATGLCAAPTDDECNGQSDPANMQGHTIPNGVFGNGFDDDCDGLVDEGCNCDPEHQVGTTKECYLMPSSWVDDGTGLPTGWCADNSRGTVKCISKGGNPEQPIREWDGECRGAQVPSGDDFCAMGDFNCDGVQMNPAGLDCSCIENPVTCPTEPLKMNPFPDQNDLTAKDQLNPLIDPTKPFIIDGFEWIDDQVEAQATGWTWEMTGGDCDNILPHPTFAIYSGKASSSGKIGTQTNTLGQNGNQHGFVTPAADGQHQIFPAFSLSGDYVVKGSFVLQGNSYQCTVKVQVRAPGVRAELCWDSVGSDGDNDVDIHFARLQGNTGCSTHGWFLPCGGAPNADDCFFSSTSGCTSGDAPGWGYPDSHKKACHGWGSLRGDPGFPDNNPCTNPRLDRDNISCMKGQKDPNGVPVFAGEFCGPENINLDNPNVGDRFAVGAQCYGCAGGSHPKTHPHINIYCNGERKYSAGYDPAVPGEQYPALVENGGAYGGSMWEALTVTWKGGAQDPCQIDPIPSKVPNAATDGTNQVCVDNGPKNQGMGDLDAGSPSWPFTSTGSYPTTPDGLCWH